MAAPNANMQALPSLRDLLKSGLGVPLGVLAVLAMVVLPLPPIALDLLFTFNIALSLVVLMAVFYVRGRSTSACSRPCCCSRRCCAWRSTWHPPAWCCCTVTPAPAPPAR